MSITSMTSDVRELKLTLPWPAKELSPNARAHHFAKARAAAFARKSAWLLTLEALHGQKPGWKRVALHWTFHPKTANRPDLDNCIASQKAAADGIADGLGTNDANFLSTYSMAEPVKGGAVLVTVRSA